MKQYLAVWKLDEYTTSQARYQGYSAAHVADTVAETMTKESTQWPIEIYELKYPGTFRVSMDMKVTQVNE